MKMGIKRTLIAYLAGLVACLVVPGMLKAANISINDTTSSIVVSVGQFEGGFYVGLVQIQSPGVQNTGSINLAEGPTSGGVTFSGSWIDTNGSADYGIHTVYFTEGSTNQISDILAYTVGPDLINSNYTTITGGFVSSDTSLGTVPTLTAGQSVWNENLGTYNFSLTDLTAQVKSPEPATAELLSIGLLGLLGISLVPRLRRDPSA